MNFSIKDLGDSRVTLGTFCFLLGFGVALFASREGRVIHEEKSGNIGEELPPSSVTEEEEREENDDLIDDIHDEMEDLENIGKILS